MTLHAIARSLALALCFGLSASLACAQEAKPKPRVLIFAASPIRDVQLLRALLAREAVAKRAELTVYVQADDKADAIEGEKRLMAFPDRLSDYDVIIAFDPDWSKLKDKQFKLIRDRVSDGGGFMFVAGEASWQLARPPVGRKFDDLNSIIPVEFVDRRHQGFVGRGPHALDFTPEAKGFDFLKLDDQEEGPTGGWSSFFEVFLNNQASRGFYKCQSVSKVHPEATVLANLSAGNRYRYLVTMRFGKGKSMYLGWAETWQLRDYDEAYHERFWLRLTAYLAAQPEQPKAKQPPPKAKPRVLIFASAPIREVQFLRSLMARETMEKRAELTILLQAADKVETFEGEKRLTAFPDRLDAGDPDTKGMSLNNYDVIIAFDPDWSKVSEKQLRLLRDWVEKGGGFMLVAGPVYSYQVGRPGGRDLSALQALVPVKLLDNRLRGAGVGVGEHQPDPERPHVLNFSPSVKYFDFLKLDAKEDAPTGGWSRFFGDMKAEKGKDPQPTRGFYDYYPVDRAGPTAMVLATFDGGKESRINDKTDSFRDQQPYLVTMSFGMGKTMYLGSPESWRLRLANAEYHQRFWTKMTAYLAEKTVQPRQKNPPQEGTPVKKVLIIDGENAKGRAEAKDTWFIERALDSIPRKPYEAVFGDKLAVGESTKALDGDLGEFKVICLLNVRDLTPKQAMNLEKFAEAGGSVMFFLGKNVIPAHYNKDLYRDGKGVFPAPLKDSFFPPPNEPALEDRFQLLIRDEKFTDPKKKMPIFGEMFDNASQREPLKDFAVFRYFKVDRDAWKPDPKRVFELATLSNKKAKIDDPYVIASHFGKGKVVAVMSTAGKDWNYWAGGSQASILFAPFIWEALEYLSTPNEQVKDEKK